MTNARAVTIFGADDLRIVETPLADLAPGFVRLSFGAGGICGSDMHYFRHGRTGDFVVEAPLVLGHEIAGDVVAIAGEARGPDGAPLSVGDRVAVNPSRWCGRCARCREGRLALCENVFFMGSASKRPHMQGGFSTLFDAIPAQCVRVPKETPYAHAALAEPLAVCLHAVARAGPMAGRRAIVFGAGPIGLLTLMAARLDGAPEVAMADIALGPLALAKRIGADPIVDVSRDGALAALESFDVAFECSGTGAGLSSAIAAVRRGGTVVQVGNLPGGPTPITAAALVAKELDLLGSMRFGEEFYRAVDLIVSGEVDVGAIVTASFPLDDAAAGFRASLDRSQNAKVVLTAH